MSDDYELVEDDVEVVGGEEPVVDDTEVVEEDDTMAVDEVDVVGRPRGDPVLEYAYGYTNRIPTVGVIELLVEYRRYNNMAMLASKYCPSKRRLYGRLAGRYARMIYANCPYKRIKCPLTSYTTTRCPLDPTLEKRCRGYSARGPKKIRRWYR